MVVGARLIGSADDTVEVWAVSQDMGAGDTVGADDLVPHRVRFADTRDLDTYFRVDDELPADLRLLHGITAGELLSRAAVGPAAESETIQLPVAVDSSLVPPGVRAGSIVDVYLTGSADGVPRGDRGQAVLSGVTVIEAPRLDDTLGATGRRQLVLGVSEDEAARYFRLVGTLDDPRLTVLRRG